MKPTLNLGWANTIGYWSVQRGITVTEYNLDDLVTTPEDTEVVYKIVGKRIYETKELRTVAYDVYDLIKKESKYFRGDLILKTN